MSCDDCVDPALRLGLGTNDVVLVACLGYDAFVRDALDHTLAYEVDVASSPVDRAEVLGGRYLALEEFAKLGRPEDAFLVRSRVEERDELGVVREVKAGNRLEAPELVEDHDCVPSGVDGDLGKRFAHRGHEDVGRGHEMRIRIVREPTSLAVLVPTLLAVPLCAHRAAIELVEDLRSRDLAELLSDGARDARVVLHSASSSASAFASSAIAAWNCGPLKRRAYILERTSRLNPMVYTRRRPIRDRARTARDRTIMTQLEDPGGSRRT